MLEGINWKTVIVTLLILMFVLPLVQNLLHKG